VRAKGLREPRGGAISVELPGPIAVGVCVGVALGLWVALAMIWPRTRPPKR
jgi:hypothetical protein